MANAHGKGGVTFYYIIALVLGALTYIEFAIVEYEIAWLNGFWTIALLIAMSLLKFALVIAIYMHLRDDDPIYTGFFSSGLVIALGTFIALTFTFTVSSVSIASVQEMANEAEAVIEGEVLPDRGLRELELLVAEERPLLERYRVPEPKRQSVFVPLPEAPVPEFSLRSAALTPAPAADETGSATPNEPAQPSGEVLAQAVDFDWQALGEQAYTGNCAACHQANGQGVPGAFPPLVEHMSTLYNAEGGREYVINVVLYGLQGEINVLGQTYNGVMPPFSQLSNEQVAAILNHELTSWGNDALLEEFTPLLPDEVEAQRGNALTAAQVLELRPDLP